jgi:uncharacterized protein involved in type VI secretion and phage assembly
MYIYMYAKEDFIYVQQHISVHGLTLHFRHLSAEHLILLINLSTVVLQGAARSNAAD